MDKYLVVGFDNELRAYEGSRALQDLQNQGSINLYAKAVIVRDASGEVAVKQQGDMGPVGTAVGMLTGSLIGLIGGPVGVAIGAYAGTVGGLFYDLGHLTVGEDFLSEVEQSLQPGKAAVVAEVWEEWTTPVDTRMHKLDGIVFRRLRGEVVADQLMREGAAFETDLKALNDDLKQAAAENRAAIQKDIERVKKQIKVVQDQAKARLDQAKAETDAKVKALQDQAKAASGMAKARIEKRVAAAKTDLEVRSKKLSQAWELTKEALAA
jgi:uncharacterized membrane protein